MMDTIYYYLPFLETIRDFLEMGGPVLKVIGVLVLFMWMLIFERLFFMQTGYKRLVKNAHEMWFKRTDHSSWKAHQIRAWLISKVSAAAEKRLALIKTCVALCPLLGLLGTVTGMVQVFEVMAISGSGNPRSMASGVSMATIPTMAGMVAALSGVAMGAFLQNKASREREHLADNLAIHAE